MDDLLGLEIGEMRDYMGSTCLITNLFRILQIEEKLRKDVTGAEMATAIYWLGKK